MNLNLLQTLLPSFQPLKWWFLWPRQVAFVPAYASTGGRQVKGRVSTWFFIELYFFLHFWLHWVFLLRGLLPSCGARASCCSGRSCWGARALGHWGLGSLGSRAQQLLLLALEHKLNTRGAGTELLPSAWNLPRPGIEPRSIALSHQGHPIWFFIFQIFHM